MIMVIFLNAGQAIILATMAICTHPQGTSGHWMAWSAWKRSKPYVLAVSVNRSQPNWILMGDSGVAMGQRFPPPSTKHQMMEILVEEWCRIPPIEFQTLVESMPKVLWSRSGLWWPNALLKHFMLVFPLFWQLPVSCHGDVQYCGIKGLVAVVMGYIELKAP